MPGQNPSFPGAPGAPNTEPKRYLSAAISIEAGSEEAPNIAAQGGTPLELADMLDRAANVLRAQADPEPTTLGDGG